jgi:hypothetical protein
LTWLKTPKEEIIKGLIRFGVDLVHRHITQIEPENEQVKALKEAFDEMIAAEHDQSVIDLYSKARDIAVFVLDEDLAHLLRVLDLHSRLNQKEAFRFTLKQLEQLKSARS